MVNIKLVIANAGAVAVRVEDYQATFAARQLIMDQT